MLVLTRKIGESIKIGDDIYIRVVQVKSKQVRIGVEAPHKTKIQREELKDGISLAGVNMSKSKRLTKSDVVVSYDFDGLTS